VRIALVAALASCAEGPLQSKTRRFLTGLSCDELQFLAEFLGASIIASGGRCRCSRAQLAERVAEFQKARAATAPRHSVDQDHNDQDHKMILLHEFLNRSGVQQIPVAVRASHA
jgi:hypothetical protein